jgi:hypothetical protein
MRVRAYETVEQAVSPGAGLAPFGRSGPAQVNGSVMRAVPE